MRRCQVNAAAAAVYFSDFGGGSDKT